MTPTTLAVLSVGIQQPHVLSAGASARNCAGIRNLGSEIQSVSLYPVSAFALTYPSRVVRLTVGSEAYGQPAKGLTHQVLDVDAAFSFGAHDLGRDHSRSITEFAGTISLGSPFAFVAEPGARFHLAGGSAGATLVVGNPTVGSLARRVGIAFVRRDAASKTVGGWIRDGLVLVLGHVISVLHVVRNTQLGIPLMEVSA
jgi:hypothetical protein